jgi:hypothetical protein
LEKHFHVFNDGGISYVRPHEVSDAEVQHCEEQDFENEGDTYDETPEIDNEEQHCEEEQDIENDGDTYDDALEADIEEQLGEDQEFEIEGEAWDEAPEENIRVIPVSWDAEVVSPEENPDDLEDPPESASRSHVVAPPARHVAPPQRPGTVSQCMSAQPQRLPLSQTRRPIGAAIGARSTGAPEVRKGEGKFGGPKSSGKGIKGKITKSFNAPKGGAGKSTKSFSAPKGCAGKKR